MERARIYGINGDPILVQRDLIKVRYKAPVICDSSVSSFG